MRLSSAISNNNSGSFLKAHSQMQDSFEPFLNDFNNMKGFFLDLSKHDSFSSTSTSDSGRSSESSREEISFTHKSKHQVTLERRHRNFQIKKKTEVRFLSNKKY